MLTFQKNHKKKVGGKGLQDPYHVRDCRPVNCSVSREHGMESRVLFYFSLFFFTFFSCFNLNFYRVSESTA